MGQRYLFYGEFSAANGRRILAIRVPAIAFICLLRRQDTGAVGAMDGEGFCVWGVMN